MNKNNYPNIEFPRELDICLTNQCNLSCGYCYFAKKKYNNSDWLTIDDIKRAFDLYLEHIKPERVQKISLTGGEPFLNFPLLLNSLKLARKSLGTKANIEIFTNGTLLSPVKAEALLRENPMLIISVDGIKKIHDAARKFCGEKDKSVFDVVFKNIESAGRDIIGHCYGGVTFCGESINHIYESIDFLLSMGFKGVRLDFDVLKTWKANEINKIRDEIIKIKKLYAETVELGFGDMRQGLTFDFIIPPEELSQLAKPPGLREIALAPDKCFYPSGLVSTYGNEKEIYRIGDLDKGFDCLKMNKVLKEVRSYFSANKRDGYNGCPVHVYFAARLNKKNPNNYFEPGEKFYNALKKIVNPISDFEIMLNFLASKSGLGDFNHKPKYTFDKEISVFEMYMSGHKFNMSDLRNGCDLFLYSPGNIKNLIIKIRGGDSDFEKVKAVVIYVLMRAKNLLKELRVNLIFDCPVNQDFAIFAAEHGLKIFIESNGMNSEKNIKALFRAGHGRFSGINIVIDSKNCESMLKLAKKAASFGIGNIRLCFNSRNWNSEKLKNFADEFKMFIGFIKSELESGNFIFISNIFTYLAALPANCAVSDIEMSDKGNYHVGHSMVGHVSSGIKREFFNCSFDAKSEKCVSCFKSNFYGDISNDGIAALIIFRKGIRKFVSFVLEKSKSDEKYERYVKKLVRVNNDCAKLFKSCYEDK